MARFKWAKNISNYSGGPRRHLIAAATAIELGEVVKFTPGTGVVAYAEYAQPRVAALGVAAVEHDGATDDGVQKETSILVYDHPDDIFELRSTKTITADSGSTTTFIEANTGDGDVNDLWIDGYLEVVSCAADSTMNGKMIKITDYAHSSGTFTFDTQPAAFASGDTVILHPGRYAVGTYHFDLTSDGTDIDYVGGAADGYLMQLYDVDPERKKAYYKLRMHYFGQNDS